MFAGQLPTSTCEIENNKIVERNNSAKMVPPTAKPAGQENKSWRKINEERKAYKRERRQERLIREVENAEKIKELAKIKQNEKASQKPDPSTVSIAVPGSILENAQSPELRSYLAGQIARAASIFRVNEIIVFDDIGIATARETKVIYEDEPNAAEGEEGKTRTVRASCLQLARILQYLECPQYLRKFFFPLHRDLKYSGIMNPLDTPHHLRQQTVFLYREGVVSEKPAKEGRCFVNVGLLNDVLVDKAIKPGVRVTVKLENVNESKKLRGIVVSPDEPRRETGVYWGYTVRIAHSLSEIFTKSPYKGGYDCTIGTSDRGTNIQEVEKSACAYAHLLIVFGGLAGLEAALANEEQLNVEDPALLFDHYVNVLPKQGSRTIRTEEAVLIAMSALQEKLQPQVPDIEDKSYQDLLPKSEDTGIKPVYEQKPRLPRSEPDKVAANSDEDLPIVHSNPFINGVTKRETASEPADELATTFNSKGFSTKAKSEVGDVAGDVRFKPNNPFTAPKVSNARRGRYFSVSEGDNANAVKPRKNDETHSSNNNPFKRNKNNVEKKRKFKDSQIDVVDTEKNSTKKLFVKLNTEQTIKIDDSDDLEVVPAGGTKTTTTGKQKKLKKDLDLSRFD